MLIVLAAFCFNFILIQTQKLEGFIVKGDSAEIERFPHSVFLAIQCSKYGRTTHSICGASIINQLVVLSAAHCFDDCDSSLNIVGSAGHANRGKGLKSTVKYFTMHPKYDPFFPNNDIALAKLKTAFPLGPKISRVVITQKRYDTATGYVTGWGYVNENTGTRWLKHTKQPLISRRDCEKVVGKICDGCFCAGKIKGHSYATCGGSGNALVVNNYIQVGIVSYKIPEKSLSVVMYTDVSYEYYYKWIKDNVEVLLCDYNRIQ